MHVDGQGRRAVVGEHPLPLRLLPQRRCRGRGVEREGELSLLARAAGNALRARGQPELPEEDTPPAAERVAGARGDECLQPGVVEPTPLRQLTHSAKRAGTRPLRDQRLGFLLAE